MGMIRNAGTTRKTIIYILAFRIHLSTNLRVSNEHHRISMAGGKNVRVQPETVVPGSAPWASKN